MQIQTRSPARERLFRPATSPLARAGVIAGLCLVLVLCLPGCRLIQGAADLPGDAMRVVLPGGGEDQKSVDIVELQQTLMRFSDDFTTGMLRTFELVEPEANKDPAAQAALLEARINLCNSAWGIAAGQNSIANLLDMVTIVSLLRMSVENYWIPQVYGDTALPILEEARKSEQGILTIAGRILTEKQLAELRQAIEDYYANKPNPEFVLYVRAYVFQSHLDGRRRESEGGSVFGLLGLDPLAGLSPATREIAQTRLFGERSVFLAQRMPAILRWQTELAALEMLQYPQVDSLIQTAADLAETARRVSLTAEALPGQISREREEILSAVEGQQEGLTQLAGETRMALDSGAEMAANVNQALQTLNDLLARFDTGEEEGGDSGTADKEQEPFRIQDYTAAASEISAAARELTALIQSVDTTMGSPNLPLFASEVDDVTNEIVDHIFIRALQLLFIFFVLLLAYRLMASRRPGIRTQNPPAQS